MKKKLEPGNLLRHVEINLESEYQAKNLAQIMDAKNESPEHQRLVILDKEIKHVRNYTRSEYENVVYWSGSAVIPMYTDKYFVRYKTKEGVTYNRKTKTFKIWYGKSFQDLSYHIRKDIIKFMGKDAEFLGAVPRFFLNMQNVSMVNKIAKGKITNPKDYIKYYLKEKFPKMKISTELVWKMAKLNAVTGDIMTVLLSTYNYVFKTCTNPDALINHVIANPEIYIYKHVDSLRDTAEQAFVMGKKFSYCWSQKRLEEEHSKLSREVAMLKFSKEPLIDYGYPKPVPHPFLTLLTNNKELFIEGSGMSHCVYSNYSSRVAAKEYFVFHYDDGEVFATVGVTKINEKWFLDQMRTRKNGLVSDEIQTQVREYLLTEEMQDFFNANSKVKGYVTEDISII
jgi:hypothetical protein